MNPYRIITRKDGSKDVAPLAHETDEQRTERLKLKALVNGLFAYVHPGFYRVNSTHGSTRYDVRWIAALGGWACTCEGYAHYCYKYPACPCIHVATVLMEIGDSPTARTLLERIKRKGDALYQLTGSYTYPERTDR